MQTGQVSVWVTVAVALLGILGVAVGHLITAWREDQRWKREVHREELRWQRQVENEHTERQHDARMQWKEQRLDAYVGWDSSADNWFWRWGRAMSASKDAIVLSHDVDADLLACHAELRLATSRVELLGSPFVVKRVKDIMLLADELWRRTLQPGRHEDAFMQGIADMMDAETSWIREEFRYDLGVAEPVGNETREVRRAVRAQFKASFSEGNLRRYYDSE